MPKRRFPDNGDRVQVNGRSVPFTAQHKSGQARRPIPRNVNTKLPLNYTFNDMCGWRFAEPPIINESVRQWVQSMLSVLALSSFSEDSKTNKVLFFEREQALSELPDWLSEAMRKQPLVFTDLKAYLDERREPRFSASQTSRVHSHLYMCDLAVDDRLFLLQGTHIFSGMIESVMMPAGNAGRGHVVLSDWKEYF